MLSQLATGSVAICCGVCTNSVHEKKIKVRLRFDRGSFDVAFEVRATYFLHKNCGGTSKYISNYSMGLRGFEKKSYPILFSLKKKSRYLIKKNRGY